MRIGTTVVLAPLHHPVHLAEQAVVVDLVSGGRLDLGVGAGYSRPEFDLFDADIGHRYATTDQRCRELRQLWSERIHPRPVQADLPIWMGYAGPQGARRAGLLGAGLLTPNHAMADPYLAGLAEAGYASETARMAGNASAWVTNDPECDWPVVSRHLSHMFDTYRAAPPPPSPAPIPRPRVRSIPND